jgi:hypothetical protein
MGFGGEHERLPLLSKFVDKEHSLSMSCASELSD